jgi:hypothetical protein
MTLAEAGELLDSWDEQPPAFMSLARIAALLEAALGVKRPRARPGMPPAAEDMAQLRAALGTGDVHAGLGQAAILDFAALKERLRHG